MKKKKRPKETAIYARVSPELLVKVKKLAALKQWTLSKTAAVGLEQLIERTGVM